MTATGYGASNLTGFLGALPKIASHPLAILAYVCLVSGWLLLSLRWRQSQDFLKTLDSILSEQRVAFCRNAGFSYDELGALPRKDRLTLLTRRYLLIAVISSIIAVCIIVLAGLLYVRDLTKTLGRIDDARTTLQEKYENEVSRGHQLV